MTNHSIKGTWSGSRDRFLLRDAMLAGYLRWSCVRLSVCPSDISRLSTKKVKRGITQTTSYDSSGNSFVMPKILREIPMGHFNGGSQVGIVG